MLYVIYARDVPDSLERRKSARARHLERLQTMQAEGRIVPQGKGRGAKWIRREA